MAILIKKVELSWLDRTYVWPVLKGMAITLGHFLRQITTPTAKRYTIQYPEMKKEMPEGYRGLHELKRFEDGSIKCVACFMCAEACPARCITIEAEEFSDLNLTQGSQEKRPLRFEIDLLRCVYCGFCVDACPEEAIIMSRENDLVGTTRAELIIDRDRLMARNKLVEHGPGYRPVDHDVRRPVRIAALERLEAEHGIVPGMPAAKAGRP